MTRSMHRLLAIILFAVALAGCATSPTGRSQLKMFSPQKMAAMGDQSYAQLKQKTPIDHNAADNRFVECVAHAITAVPGVEQAADGSWHVTVFKSKQINAFALPGGNIGVYSGLLPVTKNGAQLAAVIGHEVGHVLAGHPNERMSEQYATQGGLSVLSAFLGGGSSGGGQAIMSALGVGAQVGILLPFSRAQESEADLIGLELMARAGFDPRQSVQLWKNMTAASNGQQPNPFLSTHPSNNNRIQALEAHMNKAMQLYQQAPRHPSCPHP
ncbi:M48 family metallopeptidase [Salinisphaera hydrothermalis]|uniref:Peptidase M48 Ste24p n=1 Tax=Salinisphaera hydrothermalis (strain C41B8) TaxID=1304275 RepID=A0A084IGF0_SALHC|nr:M48 family metallopeptidase [Salinisphaera hydrothermalis]KEZ75784.1 peptidase M48 Ste24p [Salinisphaera hydrothermalis C41B8]